MAIDYTLTVKKIHSLEKIYVLFSASTRMPFVECDPEEFDDQIYIFANEELATAAAKAYAEKQMPTGVIPMEKSQYLAFFGSLHLIGVNMLVFEDEGGVTRMPLDEIARLDPKVAEKKEVPMLNRAQTAELQKIGVNVNQIARRLNSMGPLYTQDVADIKGALAQIWQLQRYILSSQR